SSTRLPAISTDWNDMPVDIAARSRQVCHQAASKRIQPQGEDDRDFRRRLLCRPSCVSSCDNDVDLEPDELGCDLAETLSASLRPAVLDCDDTPLNPSEFAQSLHKSAGEVNPTCGGAYSQEANSRQPAALLRARREGPYDGRAANERDEFAPL